MSTTTTTPTGGGFLARAEAAALVFAKAQVVHVEQGAAWVQKEMLKAEADVAAARAALPAPAAAIVQSGEQLLLGTLQSFAARAGVTPELAEAAAALVMDVVSGLSALAAQVPPAAAPTPAPAVTPATPPVAPPAATTPPAAPPAAPPAS